MKNGAAILKQRARLLAQTPEPVVEGDSVELLEFRLSGGIYCLEMIFIDDVQTLGDLTPLPGTPAFFLGLVAVRGQIRCVLDPKELLELESTPRERPKVVLLSDGIVGFGILVDHVEASRVIRTAAIQPPLPGPSRGSRFVKGLVGNGILLDAKTLLNDPSILVYQGESS